MGKREPLACAPALCRASAGKPDTAFAGDVILQASLGQHAVPAIDFMPAMTVDGTDGGGESGAEPGIDPEVAAYLAAGGPLFPERVGEQGIAEDGKPIDDAAPLASLERPHSRQTNSAAIERLSRPRSLSSVQAQAQVLGHRTQVTVRDEQWVAANDTEVPDHQIDCIADGDASRA